MAPIKGIKIGLLVAVYEKYTSIERVIKENVVVNKKDLNHFYPEEYEKCEIELTPRLTSQ